MGRIYESMITWLRDDEWTFREVAEDDYVVLGVDGQNTHLRCVGTAHEDIEVFNFYAVIPGNVPDSTRPQVAEFITRANFGMRLGAFEMDYEDGELRFLTGVDLEGAPDEALQAAIRQCVVAACATADRYYPGLMSVVYGGAGPREAIQQVEGAN